jgi:hypothetical protein
MRLVLFEGPGAGRGVRPGVLTEAGVVDVSSATAALVAHSPQHLMEQIIDGFETFRPAYERLAASALPVPLDVVLRDAPRRPGMEQDGGGAVSGQRMSVGMHTTMNSKRRFIRVSSRGCCTVASHPGAAPCVLCASFSRVLPQPWEGGNTAGDSHAVTAHGV